MASSCADGIPFLVKLCVAEIDNRALTSKVRPCISLVIIKKLINLNRAVCALVKQSAIGAEVWGSIPELSKWGTMLPTARHSATLL